MYINIDSRSTQVVLPMASRTGDRDGHWEAEQWESWILTPGQRLPNAPNRLQSHGTVARPYFAVVCCHTSHLDMILLLSAFDLQKCY
jgi:hypothetical protein